MKKIRMSLVQLIFFPIAEILAIFFLSNWLRDLIVLEWDILIENQMFATGLGLGIWGLIVVLGVHIIYCLIKLYYLTTKYISDEELEKELTRIKSS